MSYETLFFIEVLVGGLLAGVMYSLVALGFVLIYKASSVFNFAQARWCSWQFSRLSASWSLACRSGSRCRWQWAS